MRLGGFGKRRGHVWSGVGGSHHRWAASPPGPLPCFASLSRSTSPKKGESQAEETRKTGYPVEMEIQPTGPCQSWIGQEDQRLIRPYTSGGERPTRFPGVKEPLGREVGFRCGECFCRAQAGFIRQGSGDGGVPCPEEEVESGSLRH